MLRLVLILSMFIFTGCREVTFQGSLDVDSKLSIKNSDNQVVNLNAGKYPLKLTASKRKVVMLVKTSNSNETQFELLMPKDVQIPENGTVQLKASETGQNFDLVANVETVFRDSADIRDVESCKTQRWETICTPDGCFNRPVDVWGQKRVVYKNRTYTRNLEAEFLTKNSNQRLATSESTNKEVQRVYVSQGPCL